MSDTQFQGFPQPTAPITERGGLLSLVWYRFLSALWRRTGSGGAGDVVFGARPLDPATDHGYLYIPGGDGPPTGTPLTYTGQTPLYADQTNGKVYAYFAPSWVALN